MRGPRIYQHVVSMLQRFQADVAIELGCGGRKYGSGVSGSYFGIDLRTGVYEGPGPNAIADAQVLPLRDDSVDMVFLVAALLLIPDTSSVLSECQRVLKPGGTLLVFDYNWWVSRRCGGIHRFSSLSLARRLQEHGLTSAIHWDCVPVRGPRVLHPLYAGRLFRGLVYLISNWIVVSGRKYT